MRLAASSDVLTLLGVQTSSNSLEVAGMALDTAFPTIEGWLETSLLRGSYEDTFLLRSPTDRSYPRLRLANSFIFARAPMSVSVDGVLADTASLVVDYHLGIVEYAGVLDASATRVVVSYTSGFALKAGDAYLLDGVPDSLKSAHLYEAAAVFLANPTNLPRDKSRAVKLEPASAYNRLAHSTLVRSLRPRATVQWTDASTKK